MKLPNGYGSVTKLSGNRRKPYMIRKTIGWNEKGHPKYLPIGYTETREEGLIMLAEYNKNPYDVDKAKITLEELYLKYTKTNKYEKSSKSSKTHLSVAFNKAKDLKGKPYKEIKSYQMQKVVDDAGGYSSQGGVKTFWKNMDKYAMKLDIIDKMYSDLISADPVNTKPKTPFSEKELELLWEKSENTFIQHILVLLYTGFRISEYLDLKVTDVDLEKGTFTGGSKTAAGKDRVVPIHHKILPFIEQWVKENKDYVVYHEGRHLSYYLFNTHFKEHLTELKMSHTLHEARHTFRTRLDNANANKVSIDLLMGHSSGSVGERIYTHKTIEQLKETVELLS